MTSAPEPTGKIRSDGFQHADGIEVPMATSLRGQGFCVAAQPAS